MNYLNTYIALGGRNPFRACFNIFWYFGRFSLKYNCEFDNFIPDLILSFFVILGILADELPVDEAAFHAAIMAINNAIDGGETKATLRGKLVFVFIALYIFFC